MQEPATPPLCAGPHLSPEGRAHTRRVWACALMAVVIAVWLLLDQCTKAFFNTYEPGEVIAGPFAGLFQFRLVHNTGAAWGIFDQSTLLLGVFSLVVCVVLAVATLVLAPQWSRVTVFSAALVVAGGIGNVIDRFALGYVVDFIETTFIGFPVFNVADIGVTCGVTLFLITLIIDWYKEGKKA